MSKAYAVSMWPMFERLEDLLRGGCIPVLGQSPGNIRGWAQQVRDRPALELLETHSLASRERERPEGSSRLRSWLA